MSPTPTAEPPAAASADTLDAAIDRTRLRAMFEMLPVSMSLGLLVALGVAWVLQASVAAGALTAWVVGRTVMAALRVTHGLAYARHGHPRERRWYLQYMVLAMLDGAAWGGLGWGVTPLHQMEVAAVSIGVLTGVAALGTFMLHVDFRMAGAFILPLLLPNAVYCALRQDSFGWFGAATVTGLAMMLLMEAWRSNQRIVELLRLRLESDQVARVRAEALHQAQLHSEAKGRFLATMSHEMRTPLHGILGLARLLSQGERDGVAMHRLGLIRNAGEHLLTVINDVLDFSRMEAGGLPVHMQAFDLGQLVDEVVQTAQPMALDKGLHVNLSIDPCLGPAVMGDPVRVRQVLHNLVGNAVKFTERGSVEVRVRCESADGAVCLEVQDTGIGIPPAELPRIFQAFHQAEGTYQRRFGGAGLGLAISRELARAMGGELDCRSREGQGSVFSLRLRLPPAVIAPAGGAGVEASVAAEGRGSVVGAVLQAAAESVQPAVAAVPAPPPTSVPAPSVSTLPASMAMPARLAEPLPAARVLLVEDNEVNALVAEAELASAGLSVTVARNGLEALECLGRDGVDLVLMDCEMPELDGFETTRRLRRRERELGLSPIAVVALTANGTGECRDRCLEAGMNDHLSKPFQPEELRRMLARYLVAPQADA